MTPPTVDHIILHATDRRAAAEVLAKVLDVDVLDEWGPFVPVQVTEGVTVDFVDDEHPIPPQHLAFVVGARDLMAARRRALGLGVHLHHTTSAASGTHEAAPRHEGFGFTGPDGHVIEITARATRAPAGGADRPAHPTGAGGRIEVTPGNHLTPGSERTVRLQVRVGGRRRRLPKALAPTAGGTDAA